MRARTSEPFAAASLPACLENWVFQSPLDVGYTSNVRSHDLRRLEGLMTSILVVDDDVAIREMLELVFAESGHEVQTARDGSEAVDALLLSLAPVVVVLDVKMPRMGGEEVIRL